MEKRQVILVGGGIAGAATAWALAEAGVRGVLLLEAAETPGVHSTGRNAAILRSAIPSPDLHALARESVDFYHTPPAGFAPVPMLQEVGVALTAAAGPDAEELRGWITQPSMAHGGESMPWSTLREQHPYLREEPGEAWFFPREGVLDVHAILHAFLYQAQLAGVECRYRHRVTELLQDSDGVHGVRTAQGDFHAPAVVLAEGGWARGLLPASRSRSLVPHRRHLIVSAADASIDPTAPVVWNQGAEEFYIRPESGGLLLSPCDHVPVDPQDGEVLDREVLTLAAEKAMKWLPGLPDLAAAHAWAGMRTFPVQGGFQLGADPQHRGLFWCAGLGGHGITCAPAVGRRTARQILEACPEISGDPVMA